MTKNEILEAGFKSAMFFVERQIDAHYQAGAGLAGPKADSWFKRRNELNRQWHELDRYRHQATVACCNDILAELDRDKGDAHVNTWLEALDNGR